MTVVVLVVIQIVLLFLSYTAGIAMGVRVSHTVWLDYIKNAGVQVMSRTKVSDLYPEKKND